MMGIRYAGTYGIRSYQYYVYKGQLYLVTLIHYLPHTLLPLSHMVAERGLLVHG